MFCTFSYLRVLLVTLLASRSSISTPVPQKVHTINSPTVLGSLLSSDLGSSTFDLSMRHDLEPVRNPLVASPLTISIDQ